MKIIVTNEFRDISSFKKIHEVGDVIEVEQERADRLISLDLAKPESVKKKAISLKTKEETILSNIAKCEDVDVLNLTLEAENSSDKRESVITVIESRIKELE